MPRNKSKSKAKTKPRSRSRSKGKSKSKHSIKKPASFQKSYVPKLETKSQAPALPVSVAPTSLPNSHMNDMHDQRNDINQDIIDAADGQTSEISAQVSVSGSGTSGYGGDIEAIYGDFP